MNKFNIYLDILRTGLENIRRASRAGDIRQAMLEKDHIANLPDQLSKKNFSDKMYWDNGRRDYIRRASPDFLRRFMPLWEKLERSMQSEKAGG